jgi:hypothetical protein
MTTIEIRTAHTRLRFQADDGWTRGALFKVLGGGSLIGLITTLLTQL